VKQLRLTADASAEDGTIPNNVQCAECLHVWVGFYLPQPIAVVAKQMKNLTCPKCGADAKRVRLHP
jgi:Zn finger protein HypA/HybF involved in hydrogenase expression